MLFLEHFSKQNYCVLFTKYNIGTRMSECIHNVVYYDQIELQANIYFGYRSLCKWRKKEQRKHIRVQLKLQALISISGGWLNSRSERLLLCAGYEPLLPLNRKLAGPHTSSESCGRKKSPWPWEELSFHRRATSYYSALYSEVRNRTLRRDRILRLIHILYIFHEIWG